METKNNRPDGWLPPGSDEAYDAGCVCPWRDNEGGLGVGRDGERFGWWMNADCPLHGEGVKTDADL